MTGWKVSLVPISGLKRKFMGFAGCWVSVELRFLKASFPEEFDCGKKVPLGGWVSLKVSFPVNSGRRKEVSCDGGALGVYKVRLKVDR